MHSTLNHQLAIFDKFKTKDELTGRAKRQRSIIQILYHGNLNQNTKVEIAKYINENNKQWRNTYSAVYEDIENIFLPHKIIREKGRVPLKRGPKELQKKGTAIYELTKSGMLLLYCINEGKTKIDFREFTSDNKLGEEFNRISEINPSLWQLILEKYLSLCNRNNLKMVPITYQKLNEISGDKELNLEVIESSLLINTDKRIEMLNFISKIKKTKH